VRRFMNPHFPSMKSLSCGAAIVLAACAAHAKDLVVDFSVPNSQTLVEAPAKVRLLVDWNEEFIIHLNWTTEEARAALPPLSPDIIETPSSAASTDDTASVDADAAAEQVAADDSDQDAVDEAPDADVPNSRSISDYYKYPYDRQGDSDNDNSQPPRDAGNGQSSAGDDGAASKDDCDRYRYEPINGQYGDVRDETAGEDSAQTDDDWSDEQDRDDGQADADDSSGEEAAGPARSDFSPLADAAEDAVRQAVDGFWSVYGPEVWQSLLSTVRSAF
jgi:hypothetical protein